MSETQTMMRVRPTTKDFFRSVAKLRGWKMAEAAERAATALAKNEGVNPPQVKNMRRRAS